MSEPTVRDGFALYGSDDKDDIADPGGPVVWPLETFSTFKEAYDSMCARDGEYTFFAIRWIELREAPSFILMWDTVEDTEVPPPLTDIEEP